MDAPQGAPAPSGSDRSLREAEFHNQRFADGHGHRPASRFYQLTEPSQRRFHELIDSTVSPATTLELGCGPGAATWSLLDRGVNALAVDISEAAIDSARAQARARGFDPRAFSVMNAEELASFDDDQFDLVIGSSILHHLDLDRALPEIQRTLKPGVRVPLLTGHLE